MAGRNGDVDEDNGESRNLIGSDLTTGGGEGAGSFAADFRILANCTYIHNHAGSWSPCRSILHLFFDIVSRSRFDRA